MKLSSVLLAFSLLFASPPALAKETITIDQKFARERVIKVEVTPMGLVLDFGNSSISSVDISHMKEIIFRGLDGVLCNPQADCSEGPPPTKLLLRKIKPIDFKDQEPSPDGTYMLFVLTDSGIYRFLLMPMSTLPKYTKIEIEADFSNSVLPSPILQ